MKNATVLPVNSFDEILKAVFAIRPGMKNVKNVSQEALIWCNKD